MEYNIGDTVKFATEYGPPQQGILINVQSEMDSYDEMQLKDGVALYWSKKMKKWTPVKEKNAHTVFLEVKTKRGGYAFIFMDEVMEYEPTK